MAAVFGTPERLLRNLHPDPLILKIIPEQVVRRHKVIPLKKKENSLTVAMVDPLNVLMIDDLRLLTGCEIEPVQVGVKDIEAIIQRYFDIPGVDQIFDEFEILAVGKEPEAKPVDEVVDDAPIVRLVNAIFFQAVEKNASDIHIEPMEHRVRVRYRIDGLLREVMTLPKKVCSAVISRVKIISNMDIAEKRIPQDGRIQLKFGSREIDIRVSSLPTVYGEKIVTRLLDKGSIKTFKIDEIGFETLNLGKFKNALKNTHGMILITGPTGSGKTTTLYAALNEIYTLEKNIITVEDPVEYMLEGISQTQVNTKAGMTFAAGLRAILRQDPDIIMVGEIRDGETAEIAAKASTTGHQVLSTLHTNDAAGAITRLVDMGIEPFLVASSVRAVVAQRLVRLICPNCRQAYMLEPVAPERAFMGVGPDEPVSLYKGMGCEHCENIGYRGRLAIHEVLTITKGLRPLIMKNAPTEEIKQKAQDEGMNSLKMDGIQKALKGMTTIEEVIRVAYTE